MHVEGSKTTKRLLIPMWVIVLIASIREKVRLKFSRNTAGHRLFDAAGCVQGGINVSSFLQGMVTMRKRDFTCVVTVLGLLLVGHASADDQLYVLHEDGTIHLFDEDGNGVSGSPIELMNGQRAFSMAASPGGRWLYVSDFYGGLHWVNPVSRSTSQGPGPITGSAGHPSVSADRQTVFFGSGNLYGFDASTLTNHGVVVQGTDIFDVHADPIDTLLYADRLSGVIAYNTLNWSPWTLSSPAALRYDMDVLSTGNGVVFVYDDNGTVVVEACDSRTCHMTTITGVSTTTAVIAPGHHNEFYVGTDQGVHPFLVSSNGIADAASFGSSWVRDVAVSDNGDVYVLYDDRIERYGHLGTNGTTLTQFSDGAWRYQLLVVPERKPSGFCLSCFRADLYTLIVEARARYIDLSWWNGREDFDCTDCKEQELAKARKYAEDFLNPFEKGDELSVKDAIYFLQKAEQVTRADAQWVLDELLIQPQKVDLERR